MNPPVPTHVNLQDFEFMPLSVLQLRDSEFASEASAEEFRAGVLLWCACWHQVPAGSLPDKDPTLAKLAGYGFAVKEWGKVREGALRGFVRCDDGRLYHPIIAEKACEAWLGKLRLRHKRECERIKKAAQRAKTEPNYPTFADWVASNDPAFAVYVPRDVPHVSQGTEQGQTPGQGGVVPVVSPSDSREGEGQGTGEPSYGAKAPPEVTGAAAHGAAPPAELVPLPPPPVEFIRLPIKGWSRETPREVAIFEVDVVEWETTFTAIDVRTKLKHMREWLKTHPDERSVGEKGVRQRINGWFTKDHNKALERGGHARAGPAPAAPSARRQGIDNLNNLVEQVNGRKPNTRTLVHQHDRPGDAGAAGALAGPDAGSGHDHGDSSGVG